MSDTCPHPQSSPWTFTQGLILGQLSFLVLVLLFVRYVVFSPSEQLDEEGWKRRRSEPHKVSSQTDGAGSALLIWRVQRAVLSTTGVPAPLPSLLLGKTGYDMATHPAESTDWLNVLFSQVIQGYRNDLLSAGGEEGARQRVERWLNPDGGGMSWLDPIHVTALSLGNSFPLLSHARIRPADGHGRIRAEIDVDYLDSLSLSISTAVLANIPRPRFAVLPVSLGVQLASIGGTLSIQIHDPVKEQQHLHACLLPDFHLNLKTTSLLGSRAKLQDIPKLEQLILSRLRAVIQDRLVYPNHLTLALPRFLSSSVSPTPIINDIGESAVTAMGDAMKQGFSQIVGDISGGITSQTDVDSYGSMIAPEPAVNSRISQKRIPMPAGFPHSAYASSSSNTPLQTPGLSQVRRPSHQPGITQPSFSSAQSTHRIPQAARQGRTTSTAPSIAGQSQSNFRFRGQFASQPGTPGPAIGSGMYSEAEARRVGVLNSRAG